MNYITWVLTGIGYACLVLAAYMFYQIKRGSKHMRGMKTVEDVLKTIPPSRRPYEASDYSLAESAAFMRLKRSKQWITPALLEVETRKELRSRGFYVEPWQPGDRKQ